MILFMILLRPAELLKPLKRPRNWLHHQMKENKCEHLHVKNDNDDEDDDNNMNDSSCSYNKNVITWMER